MADKSNAVIYGEIISKCWDDADFRKKFVADPESVLADAGFKLEEGVTYKVIEAPKLVSYVVIPSENVKETVQKLSASLLERVENDEVIVPEGVEIRIVQNTDDTRNLILPASPKTLTVAELKAISGGDMGVIAPVTSTNVTSVVGVVIDAVVQPYVSTSIVQTVANVIAVAG